MIRLPSPQRKRLPFSYRPLWLGGLALSLALPLAPFVALFVRSLSRNPSIEHFVTIAWLWQTLLAGAMALLAALLGGFFIYQQITASSVLERERLRRQLEAGRAALPFLLSALLEYLESCTAILLQTQNTQGQTPQQDYSAGPNS